jgi:myo-inositol-1(or 4)-monophosphatase
MPKPGIPAEELLGLARALASRAADYLLAGVDRPRTAVDTKSTGTDMVTEMDQGSERLIVEGILSARPDDGILGEEGAAVAGTSGVRWIIDPLDGTTNYLYGHPGFAVSIAAEVGGETQVGVVRDVVHRDEFTATRGGGAARNGVPLHRLGAPPPAMALVATGFSYQPGVRARQAEVLVDLLPRVRDIRRMGAAAVDLCSVACGRVDAYYEFGLAPWDLAAGSLVATEAGCVVAELDGEPLPSSSSTVVVAPAPLFEPFRALLLAAGAGERGLGRLEAVADGP